MPMGIVSDAEFDSELKNSSTREKSNSNQSNDNKPEIEIIERGRGIGNIEVPNSLRKIIGEEAAINGRKAGLDLARQLNISESSVSAYTKGATSTASYDETPNKSHIDEKKLKVSKSARAKLMMALRRITPDKLDTAKVRDVSGVAKDMAQVMKYMEPDKDKTAEINNNGPAFIFYTPEHKKLEDFERVFTKE